MTPDSSEKGPWLRLPKEKERCAVTGLSRTALNRILDETDPETGEALVASVTMVQPGARRGIKLINRDSLLRYLNRAAKAGNGLRFADHIRNPALLTIDEVVEDFETFVNFLDPDATISTDDWERGMLSTRRARIRALLDTGTLERTSSATGE